MYCSVLFVTSELPIFSVSAAVGRQPTFRYISTGMLIWCICIPDFTFLLPVADLLSPSNWRPKKIVHICIPSSYFTFCVNITCNKICMFFKYLLPYFITNWCWCWFLHTICGSVMLLLLIIEIKKECVTVSSSFITFVPWFVKIRIRFKNQSLDTHSIICYHCWGIRIIFFRVETRLWVCSAPIRDKRVFSSLKHVD